MALRVVCCTERRIPWGNGLGESRELCGGVVGDGEWRLSTTRIERNCPFSLYPGRSRTIVLMAGAGFELDHTGQHPRARVLPQYGRADFSGGWETRCTVVDGAVEVLNALVDNGIDYRFLLLANMEPARVTGQVHAIYALGGDALVRADGTKVELRRGEVACVVHDTPIEIEAECGTTSMVALLSLGGVPAASI